jgi:hypothetical protein
LYDVIARFGDGGNGNHKGFAAQVHQSAWSTAYRCSG